LWFRACWRDVRGKEPAAGQRLVAVQPVQWPVRRAEAANRPAAEQYGHRGNRLRARSGAGPAGAYPGGRGIWAHDAAAVAWPPVAEGDGDLASHAVPPVADRGGQRGRPGRERGHRPLVPRRAERARRPRVRRSRRAGPRGCDPARAAMTGRSTAGDPGDGRSQDGQHRDRYGPEMCSQHGEPPDRSSRLVPWTHVARIPFPDAVCNAGLAAFVAITRRMFATTASSSPDAAAVTLPQASPCPACAGPARGQEFTMHRAFTSLTVVSASVRVHVQ